MLQPTPAKARISPTVFIAPNGAPQPPRANDIRHGTESSSRGWLQVLVRCLGQLVSQVNATPHSQKARHKNQPQPAYCCWQERRIPVDKATGWRNYHRDDTS